MTAYFADTSAVAKRYIAESGSKWVNGWIKPAAGNVIVISDLAKVEMISVFARRRREGAITIDEFALLKNAFLLDVDTQYVAVSIREDTLAEARRLLDVYPLRTLDAIHLASALQAALILGQPLVFVSADQNLNNAAVSEGLPVEDPNRYP